MIKKTYIVIGMSCASCQAHITDTVSKISGVKNVNVNLVTNKMDVVFDEEKVTDQIILAKVRSIGYDLDIKKEVSKDYSLVKLIVSLSFSLILFYITTLHTIFDLYIPSFLENVIVNSIVQIVLTIPVIIINKRFFISGFIKLFKLKPNMDSLVALSASTSFIYSVVLMIINIVNNGNAMLYFESTTMILSLVSLGKYIEAISKNKTLDKMKDLMKLSPEECNVKDKGLTNIDDIKEGDIIIVKQGDMISVDGEIVSGAGSINEANITGEAMPQYKEAGEVVYAATTLTSGYLEVKALKSGRSRIIDALIKMVDEAANSKAPISKLADKVSLYFVPAVIFISIISFVVNLIISKDLSLSINMGLSVLVIACPCSLGLATPIAILVGVAKGANLKILYKNAVVLENSSNIKVVLFDKTGTITEGNFSVVNCNLDNDYKDIMYSLEMLSNHPLSTSIISYLNNCNKLEVSSFTQHEGLGISGVINDKCYYIGNKDFLSKHNISVNDIKDNTVIYLFDSDKVLGFVELVDKVKASAYSAIRDLHKMGIMAILITGDRREVAIKVGKELGFDSVMAEVFPMDKASLVKHFVSSNHHVMMIGDGVNDSIALEYATVGVSLTGSSDIACNSSDIILPNNSLDKVITTLRLSKRVLTTIKLSLFWAFFYNTVGIILSSGLFYYSFGIKLSPVISALCMGLSSVMVVLNALTINLFKEKKEKSKMEQLVLHVDGMMCEHCKKRVYDTVLACSGVVSAKVSLETKEVVIDGNNLNKDEIINKITSQGYKVL